MADLRSRVFDLAEKLIDAEKDTRAGKANIIVVLAALAIVLGGATLDVLQAIVRIWRPDYNNGSPSLGIMFALFLAAGLICVWIVARFDPRN